MRLLRRFAPRNDILGLYGPEFDSAYTHVSLTAFKESISFSYETKRSDAYLVSTNNLRLCWEKKGK